MSGYACGGCGQTWPTNYCPSCHATIQREPARTATATLEAPPTATAPAPPSARRLTSSGLQAPGGTARFEFTGSSSEYFRIWIVNVVLTLLTLGIYAAWAKVRKRRYYWSHVRLDGRGFDYTGNPVAILKGNLIVGAAAGSYYLLLKLQPALALISGVAFALVYPWLFQQAMRFNAWNTRHRNIRFGFHGETGDSYVINLGLPLLTPLTLGLLWPYVLYRRKRYQIENLSFGQAAFEYTGGVSPFYEYGLKAFGMMLIGVLAYAFLIAGTRSLGIPGMLIGIFVLYVFMGVSFGVYYATRITNAVLGVTRVRGVGELRAWLSVGDVLGLETVNVLAILGTLGLATPWAAMRRARYRWSCIELELRGSIDSVTALAAPAPGAMGDVAADQLGIDIAL